MKKIPDKFCCLIHELNAIWRAPGSLRKGLEVVTPIGPVDVYYKFLKFLLVSAGIRKGIEILGEVIRKTKMSLQRPKLAFIENEEKTK